MSDYTDKMDKRGLEYLERMFFNVRHMGQLIDDIMQLSKVAGRAIRRETIDMTDLAGSVVADLQLADPQRKVEFKIADGLHAEGDARLLQIVMENLLGNAWKFTSKKKEARIEFGQTKREGKKVFFVKDNGIGFDQDETNDLFIAFQCLHDEKEFEGSGIGLTTVQRIIQRHGGKVWGEGKKGKGATFYFTLNWSD